MKVIFGAVALRVEKCQECGDRALVIDGLLQCCLVEPEAENPRMYRGCEGRGRKRKPPVSERVAILARQRNRCAYCASIFGDIATNESKRRLLTLCWDHVEPYCWQANNLAINFVAACGICNGIKGARMFECMRDAIAYVWHKRRKSGWSSATQEPPDSAVREWEVPEAVPQKPEVATVLFAELPAGTLAVQAPADGTE